MAQDAPFSQAAQDDAQLRDTNDADATDASSSSTKMSLFGRFLVFMMFPLLTGVGGLIAGYMQHRQDAERKLDFDVDFIFPFLCALSIGVVAAVQTNGFTAAPAPFVAWPKVRRIKKVVRKRVIVPDENDGEDDENGGNENDVVPDKKND